MYFLEEKKSNTPKKRVLQNCRSGVTRRNYRRNSVGCYTLVQKAKKKTIPPHVFSVDHQSNRMLGTHLTANSISAPVYWYS